MGPFSGGECFLKNRSSGRVWHLVALVLQLCVLHGGCLLSRLATLHRQYSLGLEHRQKSCLTSLLLNHICSHAPEGTSVAQLQKMCTL